MNIHQCGINPIDQRGEYITVTTLKDGIVSNGIQLCCCPVPSERISEAFNMRIIHEIPEIEHFLHSGIYGRDMVPVMVIAGIENDVGEVARD